MDLIGDDFFEKKYFCFYILILSKSILLYSESYYKLHI